MGCTVHIGQGNPHLLFTANSQGLAATTEASLQQKAFVVHEVLKLGGSPTDYVIYTKWTSQYWYWALGKP